jgi:hypothetical protein
MIIINYNLLIYKKNFKLINKILMPQFDTFCFFSQIFWVFLGFTLFYLTLSAYLLPSLSTVLKIRKRKLAQMTTNTSATNLADVNSNAAFANTNEWSNIFKITNIHSVILTDSVVTNYESNLLAFSMLKAKMEAFGKFKMLVLIRTQLTLFIF